MTRRLIGLFADEEMPRPYSPTLEEMTRKALAILSKNPNGFFLMIEGGQIDWASHSNDAENVISDVIGLDEAISHKCRCTHNSSGFVIGAADGRK